MVPYIDLPPPTFEEKSSEIEPISICTGVPNIIHKWTEALTYRRDNCAHFLLEDCEAAKADTKLLVATERQHLQDLWESRPKKG